MILMFSLYVILASTGLVLFKLGSINSNLTISFLGLSFKFSIKMIIGLFCYALSFLLWMIIVSRINLTFAMPLSVALVNTVVLIESSIFLNEKISSLQLVGIFVIILGVTLIGIKK